MSDPGGDDNEEVATGEHRHRRRTSPDGERLVAERVDESLTDLLFGEVREFPTRDR